jgi:hypothetical protein
MGNVKFIFLKAILFHPVKHVQVSIEMHYLGAQTVVQKTG